MLSEKTFNHSVGGAQEDLNGNTRQMNNLGQTQDLVLQKNMLTVCLTVWEMWLIVENSVFSTDNKREVLGESNIH